MHTLADLTKLFLREWKNHLYEHGRIKLPGEALPLDADGKLIEPRRISPTSQNKVRQALHVALEQAEKMDLIPTNPLRAIDRVKETPKERTIFERDELAKLFAKPWKDIRAYAGCMLAAACGLRLGEVRGLLVGNTYLDDGYLNVVTNWQDGEGLKPPKWNDARFGVPLSERVVAALRAVLAVHPYNLEPESFAFFGDNPRVPVARNTLPHHLREALKTAEIPAKGRTFHSFRHTAASLLAGTAGMERVQRLLGHTSLAMTESYTHATDDDRAVVLEAQNDLW